MSNYVVGFDLSAGEDFTVVALIDEDGNLVKAITLPNYEFNSSDSIRLHGVGVSLA